jgi:hypothetical protein
MLRYAPRWKAVLASGGAALAGSGLLSARLRSGDGGGYCGLLDQSTIPVQVSRLPAASSRDHVQVVRVMKSASDFQECEEHWDEWLAEMAKAANRGAIAKDKCVQWLANLHVASSSAQVARCFAFGTDSEGNDCNVDEEEAVFMFYLRSDTDGSRQGCMQVRVEGDTATIDALCSIGNHSGEVFMRHLVEWLPLAAPDVTHINVTPLSNGWLRQGYYADLGFADTDEGCGVMTRCIGGNRSGPR